MSTTIILGLSSHIVSCSTSSSNHFPELVNQAIQKLVAAALNPMEFMNEKLIQLYLQKISAENTEINHGIMVEWLRGSSY